MNAAARELSRPVPNGVPGGAKCNRPDPLPITRNRAQAHMIAASHGCIDHQHIRYEELRFRVSRAIRPGPLNLSRKPSAAPAAESTASACTIHVRLTTVIGPRDPAAEKSRKFGQLAATNSETGCHCVAATRVQNAFGVSRANHRAKIDIRNRARRTTPGTSSSASSANPATNAGFA